MPVITEFAAPKYERKESHRQSPFRYPGGKYYALKYILPFIVHEEYDEYREPFIGGGCVFFALPKVKHNVINDLHSELMTVYRALADKEQRDNLIERVTEEVVTQERFDEVVAMEPKDDFEQAFKTFYINRTAYSGILHNPNIGYNEVKSSPPSNWHKRMRPCGEKLKGVEITSDDFEVTIGADDGGRSVLMYLDPPYYEADQKRAYVESFVEKDHVRLARILKHTPHRFCLSYDDCEWVRQTYAEFNIYPLQWQYNTDNISGKKRKKGKELIITNYEPNWPEQSEPVVVPVAVQPTLMDF